MKVSDLLLVSKPCRDIWAHIPNRQAATPEPQTPGFAGQASPPVYEFSPIVVNISYSLNKSGDGVQFVLPTDAYPYVSTTLSLVSPCG